jgi:hypothetical protein
MENTTGPNAGGADVIKQQPYLHTASGDLGLPINQSATSPITGRNKISYNQAVADDGRRPSGTRPRATTLIAKSRR